MIFHNLINDLCFIDKWIIILNCFFINSTEAHFNLFIKMYVFLFCENKQKITLAIRLKFFKKKGLFNINIYKI